MKRVIFVLPGLFFTTPANAHGAMAGGGGFYSGAAHPFMAWEHLLLLLAIGVLLGRGPKQNARLPLLCLATSLVAGLAAGAAGLGLSLLPGFILGVGILSGLLLASGMIPSVAATTFLTVTAGIAIGLDTDVPVLTAASNLDAYTTYIGVIVAVSLIVLNSMALSLTVRRASWTIGLQILGSWIAAISLMVLTLKLSNLTGTS